MDLEHRVQMLEQELQILKGQIQATLLDIQEQLLTNTYPALRAEEASMPPQPAPGTDAPPIKTSRSRAKVELADDDEEPDDIPASPIVKRVTLEKIESPASNAPVVKSRNKRTSDAADEDTSLPTNPAVTPSARRKVVYPVQPVEEDDDEVSDDYTDADEDITPAPTPVMRKGKVNEPKPDKHPVQPATRRKAKVHDGALENLDDIVDNASVRSNGRRSGNGASRPAPRPQVLMPKPEEPEALIDDTDDYAEPSMASNGRAELAEQTRPRRPAKLPIPEEKAVEAVVEPAVETDWTALNRLAEWVGNKVKKIGIEQTRILIESNAQRGSFSSEVRDALMQLVALYDEDGALNAQRLDAVLESLSEPAQKPSAAPISSGQNDQDQKLILRLIAGVQNAGAGMTWRKKNG